MINKVAMISGANLFLTFDDRSVDHWYGQRDLLRSADARVTYFVSHPYGLTGEEVTRLHELAGDGHAMAVHGLHHLDASEFLTGHGAERYLAEEIDPAIKIMADLGLASRDFAYPYGRRDSASDEVLRGRFSWLRATAARSTDPDEARRVLFTPAGLATDRVVPARGIDIGRRGRLNPDDHEVVLHLLDVVAGEGLSLCLYAHDIDSVDGGLAGQRNFITPERLGAVISAATERGIALRSFAELPD
ncbi:polysaccharide deacetylase family protein [Microlunatus sp. GCM10028923]|uniref:polysaccharide deacetylase family protein n=1 Tax=Microlunatus sp. GCM10028923 TaxID=3273400 RepID=UPI00361A936E